MIDNKVGIGIYNIEAWDKDLFIVTLILNQNNDHIPYEYSIEDIEYMNFEDIVKENNDLKCTFSS